MIDIYDFDAVVEPLHAANVAWRSRRRDNAREQDERLKSRIERMPPRPYPVTVPGAALARLEVNLDYFNRLQMV